MRNSFLFSFALLVILLFSTCKKDDSPSVLNISIIQQPDGGSEMCFLSSRFQGQIVGSEKKIDVATEWWWDDSLHVKTHLMRSESFIFDSNDMTYKSSVLTAPSGYIFINHFWIRIKWNDDKGYHVLNSDKAICTRKED